MKITCLGCWGAYPGAGSANSSFLLEEENYRLLIDCGSGVLSQLQRVIPIHELNALVLSHYHHDHVADIGCLQYAMLIQNQLGKREKPLPIYAPDEDQLSFSSLTYKNYTQAIPIQPKQPIRIGPWLVDFCLTIHPAFCLAMKFTSNGKSLVYTADTGWSDELAAFSQGADVLICEASLYDEQKNLIEGHLTAGEAGKLAAQANVSQLVLTHLPHYGDHQQLLQQAQNLFRGKVQLAGDSLSIDF